MSLRVRHFPDLRLVHHMFPKCAYSHFPVFSFLGTLRVMRIVKDAGVVIMTKLVVLEGFPSKLIFGPWWA